MFRRALPLVLIVISAACSREPSPAPQITQPPMTQPPPAPFAAGAAVRMTGFDATTGRVEVTDINVWETPQRSGLSCRVKHAAAATISASAYVPAEERWYFSISSGSCSGWVPQSFLEVAR